MWPDKRDDLSRWEDNSVVFDCLCTFAVLSGHISKVQRQSNTNELSPYLERSSVLSGHISKVQRQSNTTELSPYLERSSLLSGHISKVQRQSKQFSSI
jgi:hypothetical protein